jgi:protease IV
MSLFSRACLGGFLAIALAMLVACDGRPKAAAGEKAPQPHSGPSLVVLDVSAGVPEEEATSMLSLAPKKGSFDELVETLSELSINKDLRGVFVRFGSATIGFSRAQEIAEALEKIKASGKPVFCHGDGFSNSTMYAALRGCSEISLSPAGEVETVGIAGQVVYMHKLLAEELHVTIDILQVGKFKGAEEPLTRDGPSDEARASLEGVLASIRDAWLTGVKDARSAPIAALLEDGPYSPEKAKELKLVDEIAYADDAAEKARAKIGAVRDDVRFGRGSDSGKSDDLGGLVRVLAGGGGGAPVALVRASGSITMGGGDGGGPFGGSDGITERAMDRVLSRLVKDEDVRAVVLRIDSPGGSALASDLIWHRLMQLRAKKPLVVSVGDMAASGGYFMACTGNVIFAEPGSIVGSIGVVGGKIAVGHALEQIGVHSQTFAASKDPTAAGRATYGSLFDDWDEATKARVLQSMTGVYDLFLARVAEGRKTTVDKIAPFAEGRIWSGTQGKEHGLVDEIGGLGAAIAKARELAKLPADAEVESVGGPSGLLERLAGASVASPSDGLESRSPWGASPGVAHDILAQAPSVLPFVESFAPLARGERTLTALPYALVVR